MSNSSAEKNSDTRVALPASRWKLRGKELSFEQSPLVMGILNVTPDSFSDGGRFYTVQTAVDRAKRMEDDGADILDIGGESTRPYSQAISPQEELDRVVPVLEKLEGCISIPISIDTTKATVAEAAIGLGAEIINDVSGLESDPEMISIAVRSGAGVCAMHMQGTPQTMQDNPTYEDVVQDIFGYLMQRKAWLMNQGILRERICLDPGIGFGKSHEHNLQLLRNAERFHQTGQPILVGHSRKGFIAKLLGNKDVDRTHGTVAVSLALALQKIQVLRVHDVAAHKQALKLFLSVAND
jgi:dihydropteroate synthase